MIMDMAGEKLGEQLDVVRLLRKINGTDAMTKFITSNGQQNYAKYCYENVVEAPELGDFNPVDFVKNVAGVDDGEAYDLDTADKEKQAAAAELLT